jgi:hypothetical protein
VGDPGGVCEGSGVPVWAGDGVRVAPPWKTELINDSAWPSVTCA